MKANYGIDAPGLVIVFALGGLACVGVALSLGWRWLFWPGIAFCGNAALMALSSKWGKIWQRDRLLSRVAWRGDERVLDAGCGRGLLLCGAAHRVPRGGAVGVDLWQSRDQSGNRPAATTANARAEGVRVEVTSGDLRALPFRDGSFDVIVSSLVVHNIPNDDGRAAALRELSRVLAPGGRMLLQDIAHTGRYAEVLRELGLREVRRGFFSFAIFPPVRRVEARK